MKMTSILLVDDHNVLRYGLRSMLEREGGYSVVGEADNGETALKLIAQLVPDVLVVDIMLPDISGLEVIRRVRKQTPQTRVLVLSMYADPPYVREALRTGALAYVLKEAPASELLTAINETSEGRQYLCRVLVEKMLATPYSLIDTGVDDPYDLLSESERAVLILTAMGETAADIGKQLSLSVRTIEAYRSNVHHKLDLHNQTELVRYAIKRGIITLD
jgi:DNA-binding NarL/FixJ family response regulator